MTYIVSGISYDSENRAIAALVDWFLSADGNNSRREILEAVLKPEETANELIDQCDDINWLSRDKIIRAIKNHEASSSYWNDDLEIRADWTQSSSTIEYRWLEEVDYWEDDTWHSTTFQVADFNHHPPTALKMIEKWLENQGG